VDYLVLCNGDIGLPYLILFCIGINQSYHSDLAAKLTRYFES
jgi:hypothetical protein